MKTGIITLSSAQNYGAVLQCHSLCKFINDNYSEAEIIDFTPDFIVGRYPVFTVDKSSLYSLAKSFVGSVLRFPIIKKRYNRFRDFRNLNAYYSQNKYVRSYDADDYDQYIVGSDQVFNLELTKYDTEYFLPRISGEKKATYAASLGVSSLNDKQASIFKNGLNDFKNISIREKVGSEIIQSIFPDRNIYQMIDPVFLNSKEYWKTVSSSRIYKKKYILIYAFIDFDKAYSIAKKFDSKLDILYICDSLKKTRKDVKNIRGVGPKEFLSLIYNAECIVTDSFHGTAFSVIFNKPFYSIPYKGTESRFIDMLNIFNLDNRIVDSDNVVLSSEIDYKLVNNEIGHRIDLAKSYFNNVYNKD